jgi:hypothetical protein
MSYSNRSVAKTIYHIHSILDFFQVFTRGFYWVVKLANLATLPELVTFHNFGRFIWLDNASTNSEGVSSCLSILAKQFFRGQNPVKNELMLDASVSFSTHYHVSNRQISISSVLWAKLLMILICQPNIASITQPVNHLLNYLSVP